MKNIGKILAALLAVAVMLSFTMVTVFAEEATETVADSSADTTEETKAETKAETEDEHKHDSSEKEDSKTDKEKEAEKFLLMTGLVTLGIIVVVLICVAVWALKDKERALKTWRSFKSEFKKIVWADRHQTTKNTILVILAVVVFGAAIGLVDYLFSLGVVGLGKLI